VCGGLEKSFSRGSIRKVLHLFSVSELSEAYATITRTQLPQNASRASLLSRLEDEIARQPASFESVFRLLAKKLEQLSTDFEKNLERMEKKELVAQCRVLGVTRVGVRSTKREIVNALLDEASMEELLPSKARSKGGTKGHIQTGLMSKIVDMLDDIKRTLEEMREPLEQTGEISRILLAVDTLTKEIKELRIASAYSVQPDSLSFLMTMKELLASRPIDDPQSLAGILDAVAERLHMDKKAVVTKLVEMSSLMFVLRAMSDLSWLPAMDQFMKVLKQEFNQLKTMENLAEIPLMRTAASKRLMIKPVQFDEMLLKAWRAGLVKLEPSAPIGRGEVDYLKTDDGRKFFYLRMF